MKTLGLMSRPLSSKQLKPSVYLTLGLNILRRSVLPQNYKKACGLNSLIWNKVFLLNSLLNIFFIHCIICCDGKQFQHKYCVYCHGACEAVIIAL